MKPKLNVCWSCVGTKKAASEIEYDKCASAADWWWSNRLADHKMRAIDLYDGPGFAQVRRTIAKLEEKYDVTSYILSAGFGIVHQDDMIASYDATFSSSAKENRVRKPEWKRWLTAVSEQKLPVGTVCIFPRSYADPYQAAFGNLDDMILIQGTAADRVDLGCSMIRVSTTLMERIVDNQIEENWDLEPIDWKQLRGFEVL